MQKKIEIDPKLVAKPSYFIRNAVLNTEKPSKLLLIMSQIEQFFNKFEIDPQLYSRHRENTTPHIMHNYPKYMSSYSLLKLQF